MDEQIKFFTSLSNTFTTRDLQERFIQAEGLVVLRDGNYG